MKRQIFQPSLAFLPLLYTFMTPQWASLNKPELDSTATEWINGVYISLFNLYFTFSKIDYTRKENLFSIEASIRPLWRMIMIKVEYIYRSRRVRKIYIGSGRWLGWPGRFVEQLLWISWKYFQTCEEYQFSIKLTVTCAKILSCMRSFRTPWQEANESNRRSLLCSFSAVHSGKYWQWKDVTRVGKHLTEVSLILKNTAISNNCIFS